MNKLEGLLFLKKYNLPVIELISYDDIVKDTYIIKEGLSLRLSTKKFDNIDVNLPSIHNCLNKETIRMFIEKYSSTNHILIHRTVKPDIIGSISKYSFSGKSNFIVEIFKNFNERKCGIIQEREIYEFIGNKYLKPKEVTKTKYIKAINLVKDIFFDSFDIEFVIENNRIIFMDFYSNQFKIN